MTRASRLLLLCSVSLLAMSQVLATTAAAQATIEAGPSVLERILGDISTSGTTINSGNIQSLYANIAATSLSVLTQNPAQIATLDDVLGNIDSSIVVNFLTTSNQPLIAEALADFDPVSSTYGIVARTWQPMKGTLGNLSTTAIGSVLDSTASITIGAVQSVSDTVADQAMAVSQSTGLQNALAINAALNSANLNGSVIVDVLDYALEASDISTTVIGAVGGGTIVAGVVGDNMDSLSRTVSEFVGTSD
jgi:hypothetical protein